MPDAVAPVEPLYHLGAIGTVVYAYSVFRIRLLHEEPWRVRPGQLYLTAHRAETDVPVLCSQFYVGGGVARNRPNARIHFAARDDMFDRGFVAGFPAELSPRMRRLRYPINAGPFLSRMRVHPVPYPSAAALRVGRALSAVPTGTGLTEVLPAELVARFEHRAAGAGDPLPHTAGDVLRGAYADLLWESYGRDVLDAPALSDVWRERGRRATEDVRRVIGLVRDGEPLLVFPEGRPSPDGAIGPLREGVRLLISRGQPRELVPMAIAYDPLTTGRPWALLAVGTPVPPPVEEDVDETVLALLCRTLPLTCGQLAATALRGAAEDGRAELSLIELDEAIEQEAQAARTSGRLLDPGLLDAADRRKRLRGLAGFLTREGLARSEEDRCLRFDPEVVAADARLARAALEYASAREPRPVGS